jgi:ABC-2 type transport system ATP-binding protein
VDPILDLRGVRKSFGDFVAVDEVSIAVPAGSMVGFLGPNGAGKTTTIRMVMDIIAPDAGEVRLFGRPRRPEDLHRIGYLPEERGLYRKMRVGEQLLFLARLHGLARREAAARVDEWLQRLEITEWRDRKVEELSKGMQQKVQLAGTVLHDPDLLILDEPFSGLDPINQVLFKDLLADYQRRGKSILFSTHIMDQADRLCDRICLIHRGRIVLTGELAGIREQMGGAVMKLVEPDLEEIFIKAVRDAG